MSQELFPTELSPRDQPLAARMAPRQLSDFAGQEGLVGPGKMLRRLVESGKLSSALFYGPPGTGKTAMARLVAERSGASVVELNAVVTGVAELKRVLEAAKFDRAAKGTRTLLLLDEIHHFNRTQQDTLLPAVERGEVILVGLTTENPSFYVNAALLSRFTAFEFKPLAERHLAAILDRAVSDGTMGLGSFKLRIDPAAREHLLRMASGDARRLLNALELAALSTPPDKDGARDITLGVAEESIQKRAVRYDKKSDDHYDHISAFIKSLRGSDPDAALYWMAKMLVAGEDPRFIARRLLIAASEDVGLADFRALLVAKAAFDAVEVLGMPEARIPLAQAAVYVASAPKSNSAYLAVDAAMKEAAEGPGREVPMHLRDASLDAETRGHGKGYQYPHDFPSHWVRQAYMPDPMTFYRAADQGDEKRIAEALRKLKGSA
ncbi:MAG: replication-associated recombination protein A [Elusimicrobiota bacterium]|jgi:putative ATPase